MKIKEVKIKKVIEDQCNGKKKMSKNKFYKPDCIIIEDDDRRPFFIAYENKVFIGGDSSLTWKEKQDLKNIIISIASFYGWEYENAPKIDSQKLEKIIFYIFDAKKYDPYPRCPLSMFFVYNITVKNYKKEYSGVVFDLIPLPTRKHELKFGCFSITGKKNILEICDAFAELWGWYQP